jgi:penicillin-binding protein-related factor A (putative recombinase)
MVFYIIEVNYLQTLKVKHIDIKFLIKHGYKVEITYPGIIDFVPIVKKIIKNTIKKWS